VKCAPARPCPHNGSDQGRARRRETSRCGDGQKKHPEVKRLGNPNGAAHLRQYGGKAGANAEKRAASLAATIDALRAEGVTSANGIAKALSERSIAARRQVDGAERLEPDGAASLARPA
jgi:hypothetical protein